VRTLIHVRSHYSAETSHRSDENDLAEVLRALDAVIRQLARAEESIRRVASVMLLEKQLRVSRLRSG
jgi:hypothetical protein